MARTGFLSGAPALRDDPRMPVQSVVENMDDGLTAEEVAALFNLRTPARELQPIHAYAVAQRATHPV